jgi:site-specific DNA recombinase
MKYIIYCRKSTDTEDKQVLSLESQENELKRLAEAHGLNVVDVMQESMSAKSVGRPVFNEMLKVIASGKADAILCWKLDRLARNMVDGGQIMDLLQKSAIKEIRTYESIHLPSDNVLMLAVNFGMANQYIRDLSTNVKRGNRTKLEKGYWPNQAPYGYFNNKADKTIGIDLKAAPTAKRIFELYATGNYTLKEVVYFLYQEGYRTKSGLKIAKSMVHKVLINPFYCGIMVKDNTYYQGKHEPLISKELFDQSHNVLTGKNHSKKQLHFFPLRGFMTCDVCGCMLTATLQKRKYVYYYCTNAKGICNQRTKHLRAEDAEKLMGALFTKVQIDERVLDIAFKAYQERHQKIDQSLEGRRQNVQNSLNLLQERQDRLVDSFMAGITPSDVYEQRMTLLKNERVALQTQLANLGMGEKEVAVTFEQVKNVFLTANSIAKSFLDVDDAKKREYAEILLSNVLVKDNLIQQFQFKPTYQLIANISKKDDFEQVLPDLDSNQD